MLRGLAMTEHRFAPRPLRAGRILYGGDYNPDQWPEPIQDEDPALMRRAGWNVATFPVFAWAHLNPAEGVYTFDWLDRSIDRLTRAGIDLCLCTATASTPAWVDRQYPDVLTVDEQGRKKPHGNRHAFCPNSPSFRRLGGALVRQIATRYGKHPGLRLWHVNNEYGGQWPSYCYCERCTAGFRAYLEARYRDLAGLNAAWSTAFWGHTYSSFSQVDPPFSHGESSIQMMKVDWRRFQSASYLACFEHEAAILREVSPGVPVTTNLMGAFFPLDYRAWGKAMDIVSWDNYPQYDTPFSHVAFPHALTRGLRDGQPFLMLEQTPSQQNWSPYCRLKPPGRLRLQSFQAIAHGSESVMYFQWRKSRGGIEKLHGAVVEHHGREDARVFREVAAIGKELAALGDKTLGGRTPARVAVYFDWDCWWALSASSGPSRDLDYHREVVATYAALHEAGIQTDVIGPDADLSSYDVVVAPLTYIVRADQAKRIAERVRAGAAFVATFFSAMADENDRIHEGGAPGPLREVLGLTIEEFDALPPDVPQGVRFDAPFGGVAAGTEYKAGLLAERAWLSGAKALAFYTREFYAPAPAVTVNAYGEGRAYWIGTRLEEKGLAELLRAICAEKTIASPLRGGVVPPADVEVTVRVSPGSGADGGEGSKGREILYLLNHGSAAREVPLEGAGAYVDLATGSSVTGVARLDAYGVLALLVPS
jgi:beta-galactosidase